ncbi:MAG: hypothetical protein HY000_16540 [Planctomycetes bacterium]|nr:hypothetical protein [Planctomycetota bacterium]
MTASSIKRQTTDIDRQTAAGNGARVGVHGRAANDGGPIVAAGKSRVKAPGAEQGSNGAAKRKRGRPKKARRQAHGSAWHWKQTDGWYYTLAGTKKRMPLFDEDGQRIRGLGNKKFF